MTGAELVFGFGLMIVHPVDEDRAAVIYRRAFREHERCLERRDELLAAPRFQGTVVAVDCIGVWAAPGEFERKGTAL